MFLCSHLVFPYNYKCGISCIQICDALNSGRTFWGLISWDVRTRSYSIAFNILFDRWQGMSKIKTLWIHLHSNEVHGKWKYHQRVIYHTFLFYTCAMLLYLSLYHNDTFNFRKLSFSLIWLEFYTKLNIHAMLFNMNLSIHIWLMFPMLKKWFRTAILRIMCWLEFSITYVQNMPVTT